MSLVPLQNIQSSGKTLPNPVTFDSSLLRNSALKVSAPGKATLFWIAPTTPGQGAEIKIKELQGCSEKENKAAGTFQNRPIRILIKAYQALFARDLGVARDLAAKVAELEPNLAAPHIIIGLAFNYEGQKEQARVSFNRAAALDPEDAEIGQLVRMTQ